MPLHWQLVLLSLKPRLENSFKFRGYGMVSPGLSLCWNLPDDVVVAISVSSAGESHNYWSWLICIWAFLAQAMGATQFSFCIAIRTPLTGMPHPPMKYF